MYLRIGLVLTLLGALYSISQLPDYYRKQGYDEGVKDVEMQVNTAVEKLKNSVAIENARIALRNETKFREQNNEYNINLKKLESDYQHKLANGLLFNKNGICAGKNGSTTKGESVTGNDETTSGIGVLPEPYSKNIVELMHEADQISITLRALQNVVRQSSCMEIVSENKE